MTEDEKKNGANDFVIYGGETPATEEPKAVEEVVKSEQDLVDKLLEKPHIDFDNIKKKFVAVADNTIKASDSFIDFVVNLSADIAKAVVLNAIKGKGNKD